MVVNNIEMKGKASLRPGAGRTALRAPQNRILQLQLQAIGSQ
jgi:hypothetical protein